MDVAGQNQASQTASPTPDPGAEAARARPGFWQRLRMRRGKKDAARNGADAKTGMAAEDAGADPKTAKKGKGRGPFDARKRPAPPKGTKPPPAPPIQVLIGWISEASRKDVIAHARGLAEDQLASVENAWFALAPYRGGFFYEIHEGGAGRAFLPGVIEQLERDPEQILWLPAGTAINRVMTVGITDNIPYAVILTETESALVRQSGQEPMQRSGRMRRLVNSGQGLLVGGVLTSLIGLGVLGLSLDHARGLAQQPPTLVSYLPDTLPYSQIAALTASLPDDRWLLFVVYENGTWRSETATLTPLVLPEDTTGARVIAAELRSEEAGGTPEATETPTATDTEAPSGGTDANATGTDGTTQPQQGGGQ